MTLKFVNNVKSSKIRKNLLLVTLVLVIGLTACSDNETSNQELSASDSPQNGTASATLLQPTEPPIATDVAGMDSTFVDDGNEEDSSADSSVTELIALGEVIYQETAGGIGCQACHGVDALGDVGPPILNKSAADIETQLETNQAMQFMVLSTAEIEALAAYLAFLGGN